MFQDFPKSPYSCLLSKAESATNEVSLLTHQVFFLIFQKSPKSHQQEKKEDSSSCRKTSSSATMVTTTSQGSHKGCSQQKMIGESHTHDVSWELLVKSPFHLRHNNKGISYNKEQSFICKSRASFLSSFCHYCFDRYTRMHSCHWFQK